MSPRVCLGVGAISILLSLTAGVTLWGALRSAPNYRALRQTAIDVGMPLSFPKPAIEPEAAQFLEAFVREEVYIVESMSAGSLNEFRSYVRLAAKTHEAIHVITDSGSSRGRWPEHLPAALEKGSNLCYSLALAAFCKGDSETFFKELSALRILISVVRGAYSTSATAQSEILSRYCELSQFAAERSRSSAFIARLAEAVTEIPRIDFGIVASHITAELLAAIDRDQFEFRSVPGRTAPDFGGSFYHSEPITNKERSSAIKSGLQTFGRWNDDAAMLAMTEIDPEGGWLTTRLKVEEIECRVRIDALHASLRAHLDRTKGKPWPTIEFLQREGYSVTHPLNGRPYEWSTGKAKRIKSFPYSDESLSFVDVIESDSILKSDWASELVKAMKVEQ